METPSGSTAGPGPEAPQMVTANVTLSVGDWRLEAHMTVPEGPTSLRVVLPMIHSLTDGLVSLAEKSVEAEGKHISCKKGCGACCRQLVPIPEVEARRIRELVEEMPEPRRSEIAARFAAARQRMEESGMLEKLQRRDSWSDGDGRAIGLEYFQLGIACPFLEDESCSIHPDRPITCREYLVTSPAENCARPTAETVDCVPLAAKVWSAVARFDETPPGARFIRWVPLSLALEWAASHPEELPERPGPEWLQELIGRLTTKSRGGATAEPEGQLG